jgi:hypothetical protein
MNIVMNGPALMLDQWQRLALTDATGAVAEVKSGSLWITMEDDSRDIFLRPGDAWRIDRDGLTLVQAEEPSTVVLTEAIPRRRAVTAWMRAAARAIGHWLGAYAGKWVPYY